MFEGISILKTLIMSLAIIVLLQVSVNKKTLEQHALHYLHYSSVGMYLQTTAAGGALLLEKGWRASKSTVVEGWDALTQKSSGAVSKAQR